MVDFGEFASEFEMYLQIIVRWIHIIATIFWIGTTLYLGRMGRSIVTSESDEEMGTVLAVHSGAVWQYRKLRKLPAGAQGQQYIHWFKWESLLSWVSGMILLILVYWRGGLMYGGELQRNGAIALGASAIGIGVICYAVLWRLIHPGSSWEKAGAAISFAGIVGFTYLLGLVLPARTVWMHLAATFGTIMAIYNVWMIILPSQREILEIMHRGGSRNEVLAARAFRCTRHNMYMMVPLVLAMMSNHYPVYLYGTGHDWIVIAVSVLVGWVGAYVIRTRL